MPNCSPCDRRYDSAACTDSRITSPRLPVSVSTFFPFMRLASTKRISPPAAVQASPSTTPTRGARSISRKNLMGPRNSSRFLFVTTTLRAFSVATFMATLRQMVASCLSKFLSPASRVYPLMRWCNTESDIFTWDGLRP